MKHCKKCDTTKPLEEFSSRTYRSGKKGHQSYCKKCETIWRRKYYKPHSTTRNKLKISDALYEELMTNTECQICQVPLTKKCIDHDHSTGKVRGVLCNNCNTALGLVGDNIDTLTRMITYLNDNHTNFIQTGGDYQRHMAPVVSSP